MKPEDKFKLIKRDTVEIIQEKELKDLIKKNKKPTVYIGYAPTGRIHLGYFVTAIKLKDFIDAGFTVKFLAADIHAYLDDRKSPWELTQARAKYYKECMTAMLRAVGSDPKKLEVVLGSDLQRSKEYIMDLYKIMGLVSEKRARHSSTEVVRQTDNPDIGSFVYPLMQSIDPHHLKAQVSFGGIDQRKIYMLARDEVVKIGHKKPICVFGDLIPSLKGDGGKMSASVKGSGISLNATEKEVNDDIRGAYCPVGVTENNTVLKIVERIILPVKNSLLIERPEKFGGNKNYKSYSALEKDFVGKKLHPMDLKNAIAKEVNLLLEPVRNHFKTRQKVIKDAYPEQ